MPPAATEAVDKKMMKDAGLRLARNYLKAPPLQMAAE